MTDSLMQDVRYAFRRMAKSPGVSAVTLATLGLGIGAATAIFSIVNAVVIRSLPYRDADRLVALGEQDPDGSRMSIAWPNYLDFKERLRTVEDVAAYRPGTWNLTGMDVPERLIGRFVSWNFFPTLGVAQHLGRAFTPEDDTVGAPAVALLTDSLWKRRFGADPGVLGRALVLNGVPTTVIGVLPAGFRFIRADDLFMPIGPTATEKSGNLDRGNHFATYALGRLRPGTTVEQAREDLVRIARDLSAEYPATNSGSGARVEPLAFRIVENVRTTMLALMGAVGLLLVVACTNVAGLLLARGAARRHELAVRAAMGGGRGRLVRQLLTESALLGIFGATLGLVLADGLIRVLVGLAPPDIPRLDEVRLDGATFLFAAVAGMMSGLVFGAVPALQASSIQGQQLLTRSSRNGRTTVRSTRRGLMVVEIAMAVVLLTAAGLMIRTVAELGRVDPGFRADRLLTLRFVLFGPHYDEEARRFAALDEVRRRVAALPGVESAAIGHSLPIDGANWTSVFTVGDKPVPPRAELPSAAFLPVSAGYFDAMGMRLLKGRVIEEADGPSSVRIVVVNEAMVRRFWAGEDPIGKRLKQGWPEDERGEWREVVGVVADVKMEGVDVDTTLQAYLPLAHDTPRGAALVVRTRTEPLTLAPAVTAAVHGMDKDLPVFNVRSMGRVMEEAVARQRLSLVLMAAFAAIALLLAAVGLYGIVAQGVTERTSEIGVRMALGAGRAQVLRLFVGEGVVLAVLGVGLGLVGALGVGRALESLLFGVRPHDPLTLAAVVVALLLVAAAACYVPARRATRVEPLVALRLEA